MSIHSNPPQTFGNEKTNIVLKLVLLIIKIKPQKYHTIDFYTFIINSKNCFKI